MCETGRRLPVAISLLEHVAGVLYASLPAQAGRSKPAKCVHMFPCKAKQQVPDLHLCCLTHCDMACCVGVLQQGVAAQSWRSACHAQLQCHPVFRHAIEHYFALCFAKCVPCNSDTVLLWQPGDSAVACSVRCLPDSLQQPCMLAGRCVDTCIGMTVWQYCKFRCWRALSRGWHVWVPPCDLCHMT